jgi:hypothetical protein
VQRNTVLEHGYFANHRSVADSASRSDAGICGSTPPLPLGAALILIALSSLGLWWAIWLALSSLASAWAS